MVGGGADLRQPATPYGAKRRGSAGFVRRAPDRRGPSTACKTAATKPLQYVKICSLYGAGFYYIPGTDICLKVGGWTRAEYTYGNNGTIAWGWANNNANNRLTSNSAWRVRGYLTADARSQTAYGTVRSYMAVGYNDNDVTGAPPGFSANRAFIQWAGFTFGLASSFYDFYAVAATSYWGNYTASDTGDPGWKVAAYTAQFGGGFSGTISAEMRRITNIIGTGDSYGGFQSPDIVANLRIDQAWGSAQIMGALHQVNAGYYAAGVPASGHPGDKWGYAVGAGIKLNAPMIGPGDYFQAQVNFAEGAARYTHSAVSTGGVWTKVNGANVGIGVLTDGVYPAVNAGVELTKTWGFNAAYEHFWNRQWKTSVYGGYTAVRYGANATAFICGVGCDANWSTWHLGSRTQWNVSKDFYMGLDVIYSKMSTMTVPLVTNLENQDNVAVRFRVHRDFMP